MRLTSLKNEKNNIKNESTTLIPMSNLSGLAKMMQKGKIYLKMEKITIFSCLHTLTHINLFAFAQAFRRRPCGAWGADGGYECKH